MKFLIVVAAVMLEALIVSSKVLPDSFPTMCSKSVPDFNQCQMDNLAKIKPLILKGIPELDIPPLDPLELDLFGFNYTYNEDIWVTSMVQNLRGWGFEAFQVAKFDFNPHTLEGELVILLPSFRVKLNYNATVYLFGSLWKGSGAFKTAGSNFAANVKISLKKYENNGVEYYAVNKLDIEDSIGDLDLNIISDKPSQQPLIDRFLAYYNQDRQKFIQMYKPGSKKISEIQTRDIINSKLALIPANELIPE